MRKGAFTIFCHVIRHYEVGGGGGVGGEGRTSCVVPLLYSVIVENEGQAVPFTVLLHFGKERTLNSESTKAVMESKYLEILCDAKRGGGHLQTS